MNAAHAVLIGLIIASSLSLITSRQAQRLNVSATEKAQAEARRIEQDFQNLTAKQQQLEQTERIERVARTERGMERISGAKTQFIALEGAP